MKEQRIIAEVAKLDGYLFRQGSDGEYHIYEINSEIILNSEWGQYPIHSLPDYLNSRDAIVPVIEKQDATTQDKIIDFIFLALDLNNASYSVRTRTLLVCPIRLLNEALLRATMSETNL